MNTFKGVMMVDEEQASLFDIWLVTGKVCTALLPCALRVSR